MHELIYLFKPIYYIILLQVNKRMKKKERSYSKKSQSSRGEYLNTILSVISDVVTAWNVSKYGVIFGPYFPLFGMNTGKHGPEITPYLGTFHAVSFL